MPRTIRVLISFEVSDDATDDDLDSLLMDAHAQFDDPRDSEGDRVAFTTRMIGAEWEAEPDNGCADCGHDRMSLEDALATPLTSHADAIKWLSHMSTLGYSAHPDDSGITLVKDDGARLFTAEQAVQYDSRMAEVFQHVNDPYTVVLSIRNH